MSGAGYEASFGRCTSTRSKLLPYKGFTGRSLVGLFKVVAVFSGGLLVLVGDFSALVIVDGLLVFIQPPPDRTIPWLPSL